MPLPHHVSIPSCKSPTLLLNIRIVPISSFPVLWFLPSVVLSERFLLLPCSVRWTLKTQQKQQCCSSPVPWDSTTGPCTLLLQWERRSTTRFKNTQTFFRECAFLMSLCKAGLCEAHNLSKCGNFFMEIAKCTFLISEGSPAPTSDTN